MDLQALKVNIQVEKIICRDEADGHGKAEPYMWTVFFKLDGHKLSLNELLKLDGEGDIITTAGSHNNLGVRKAKAGDIINVPSKIGQYKTQMKPIPVFDAFKPILPNGIGGIIGVVTVLLEKDHVSYKGAEAGHKALNQGVKEAMLELVKSRTLTNPNVSEEELNMFEKDIIADTENAIIKKQNIIQNLWSVINKDDVIGVKVFFFTHEEVQEKSKIYFEERFQNENGDWTISGNITAEAITNLP